MDADYNLIVRRLSEASQKAETGFYIHYPFCRQKCSYCHFSSSVYERELHLKWLAAIKEEIRRAAALFSDYLIIDTVYFGGGTPSLLTPGEVKCLLDSVQKNFEVRLQEATIEVNPAAEAGRIGGWLRAGINRLSVGAQSFDPEVLRVLGRNYDPDNTVRLVEEAKKAGASNIGLDLMVGVPGESLRTIEVNLKALAELQPEHVSVYLLEELEKVPFQRVWEKSPVSEEAAAETYERYRLSLEAAGWLQYEIANFSRPGYRCRHNLKYWKYQPFLGLGPSASSHLANFRWTNPSGLEDWLSALGSGKPGFDEFIELRPGEEVREFLASGLRLREGISLEELTSRFPGVDLSGYETRLTRLKDYGLLQVSDGLVRIPPERFLISNYIISELLL
ncbi:MAG: radical SAM family heme chaperone HemW [Candidatus Saccharicenans sp.]|jgi:oxygen-independent coproporphyrinogen-3 oxidase|nr:radical SAM family heme chaperone HemW [Candidatus Saccharicenans sp.]MDH7575908.1 radical SAM family heme chaperone HemW [Candidatus Saccharicenans sp.]